MKQLTLRDFNLRIASLLASLGDKQQHSKTRYIFWEEVD